MIVVDANVLVYSLVDNQRSGLTRKLFEKNPIWKFPVLWKFEVGNALTLMVRQNELTAKTAAGVLDTASKIFLSGETDVDADLAFKLSLDRKITFYDAQYLALAHTLNVTLVTEDKALRKASHGKAVSLEEFLNNDET